MARLEAVPPRVLGNLRAAVQEETANLVAYIKDQKLSGQVLQSRSGHLRDSVNPDFQESETSVVGSAGTEVSYAGVHEYGGVYNIREHERRLTMAWGRPVKEPRLITVQGHVAHYPERSFLRSSLEENAERIKANLAAALAAGVQK